MTKRTQITFWVKPEEKQRFMDACDNIQTADNRKITLSAFVRMACISLAESIEKEGMGEICEQ